MVRQQRNSKIEAHFQREEWEKARTLLEREREQDPANHWLLTQLGVTFYEQRRYDDALKLFLASRKLVADCPLTLWNLAGTLDALGMPARALRIYTRLLQSKQSSDDDPCWESKEWTDALKADCVYRMGVSFQQLGKKRKAEHCFREYLSLLSIEIAGSYSMADVQRRMRELHGTEKNGGVDRELRKAIASTLQVSGIAVPRITRRKPLPRPDAGKSPAGRRVATEH